jgi:hypothetical protein
MFTSVESKFDDQYDAIQGNRMEERTYPAYAGISRATVT